MRQMDKLSAIKAFISVVENGSFAEAARKIGQSRSSINRSVINLEDEISVSLLNRTTRSVTITPSGKAYYERAKIILDDLTEMEESIQSEHDKPTGEISINAPLDFGILHLSSAIIDFMKMYPDIRIQLFLSDEKIDPVSSGFDMTIRISEPSGSLSLIEHEIVVARRVLCASPAYLKHNGEPKDIKELKNFPCLHYGNLPTGNIWAFTGPEGNTNILVKGVMCSNNAQVLCDAALANMGIALLPTFIAGKEIQTGRLQTILNKYQAPEIKLCLLYTPNRHLSVRIRLFVEFLQERYGSDPYWDLVT